MSFERPLRGGCHCGRNVYVVERPSDASEELAQVIFDTSPLHRIPHANPLSAFLRVPLAWYRSWTVAMFPDETSSMIHRRYESPNQQHSKRHFCGFCGTPLSYWSEESREEAEYIHLTLGSLSTEDMGDLEEMGLIPDLEEKPQERHTPTASDDDQPTGRETLTLPWFDSILSGSRLGNLRTNKGSSQSQDGRVKVEWEILEWTADHDGGQPSPAKRKKLDTTEADKEAAAEMEGIQQ